MVCCSNMIIVFEWHVLGVDLLLSLPLLPYVFLHICAYWLNFWLLECGCWLVCMATDFCGYELRFFVYVLVDLWAWLGVDVSFVC